MKASDFRIGNWIILDGFGETLVTGANLDDWDNLMKTQPIEPIPLDEEWLKRLGWTSEYTQKGVSIGAFSIETNEDKSLLDKGSYVVTTICGSFVIAWIDHVHQLQNLYFALTGKELNTIEHN